MGLMVVFTGWRLVVSLINRLSKLTLADESQMPLPGMLLSILIPVRDEALHLPALFAALSRQQGNVEIIFCNDHSSDATVALIQERMKIDSHISLIHSPTLPAGWLGKSFACFQLARQSRGDYLLFIDADVTLEPNGGWRGVRYARRADLALLSLFPYQQLESVGERLTVPIMLRCLLSMLPLRGVSCPWFASLSAANGQYMLFRREDYVQIEPHEQVRTERAEDIAIASLLKKKGRKIACLLGVELVSCRMYADYKSGIAGFSKNLDCFFGKSLLLTLFYGISASALGAVFIGFAIQRYWPGFGWWGIGVYLAVLWSINFSNRMAIPLNRLQFPWYAFLQDLVFFHIYGVALFRRITGKGNWKGRPIG